MICHFTIYFLALFCVQFYGVFLYNFICLILWKCLWDFYYFIRWTWNLRTRGSLSCNLLGSGSGGSSGGCSWHWLALGGLLLAWLPFGGRLFVAGGCSWNIMPSWGCLFSTRGRLFSARGCLFNCITFGGCFFDWTFSTFGGWTALGGWCRGITSRLGFWLASGDRGSGGWTIWGWAWGMTWGWTTFRGCLLMLFGRWFWGCS